MRSWRVSGAWLGLALYLFGSLLISPSALAQGALAQALNLQISPLPIELNVKPGTSTESDLRLRNGGTIPETLKVSLKTYDAEGLNGQIVLHDPSPNDEFLKWVSFDKTVFTAPPGEWQTIHMTVNVPSGAAFGYYYAVQFALANPPKPVPGKTGVQGAVAIFVLLNAEAPGAQRKIEVANFSADHSSYEFLPVNFTVRVHNSGNVHASAHGNIFIRRGSHQVAALPVNSTGGLVLPGSNRVFNASWSDGFPVYVTLTDGSGNPILNSKGQPKRQLQWNFSKVSHLRFGHYTADLVMVYNDGQRDIPINGTLSFWVIPWRLVGGVLIILLFMAIGLWSSLRKTGGFFKKQVRRGNRYEPPR